jgi:hypothetical protein
MGKHPTRGVWIFYRESERHGTFRRFFYVSSGETSFPSQVYFLGILSPSWKAELDIDSLIFLPPRGNSLNYNPVPKGSPIQLIFPIIGTYTRATSDFLDIENCTSLKIYSQV